MQRKIKTPSTRIVRLGSAKTLTRGIFGLFLEINGMPQDVA